LRRVQNGREKEVIIRMEKVQELTKFEGGLVIQHDLIEARRMMDMKIDVSLLLKQ